MNFRSCLCLAPLALAGTALGYQLVPDLTYDAALGLKLDLYLPEQGQGPFPTVVWIHGGGWQGGSKNNPGAHVTALADRGYVVASVDYRLSGVAVWPAQINDCKGAVRWLRANAGTYPVDGTRIATWGSSAGGHLAAYMQLSNGVRTLTVGSASVDIEGTTGGNVVFSSDVQCAVNYFGPADLLKMNEQAPLGSLDHDVATSPESRLIGAPIQDVPDLTATASPVTVASLDDGPIAHFHGDQDNTVPFAQASVLHSVLVGVGADSVFYPVIGSGHGGAGFATAPVINLVYAYFDKHLKGVGAPKPGTKIVAAPKAGPVPLQVSFRGFEPVNRLRPAPYIYAFGDGGAVAANVASRQYNWTGVWPATLTTTGVGGSLQTDLALVRATVANAGPAGVFRLARAEKLTREPDGATWVRVYRDLGAQSIVNVRLRTVNGTAVAGQDFQGMDRTLVFLNGETVKTVKVPVIADGLTEQPESFQVVLSDPGGGAVLGVPTACVVTIAAN